MDPARSDPAVRTRIEEIRRLAGDRMGTEDYLEAASIAVTVLHDTVAGTHPITAVVHQALEKSDWVRAGAAARTVVRLFDEGRLQSPRLAIAHEIEGDLLEIANTQAQLAESNQNATEKTLRLAVAAFLAGAALEDALRRLCDSHGVGYDAQRASIAKLQGALYQPSKQREIITQSENKQITAWGDTRNKADHAKFAEITHTEVVSMVLGVRAFIDRHLP